MTKANVYEMVTERIIAELEKGVIPWKKPWTGVRSGAFNRISKKPYSIINQILLKHAGEYATFKQWSELGGHIRKGEKSEMVVFWKIFEKEETNEETGEKEVKKIPMLRYYNVFHISQVEGVEPLVMPFAEVEPIEEADKIITEYVEREHITFDECASNEAFYSPSRDRVVVPMKEQYTNINEYYSTTFHELTHSTGHKNRLDRLHTGADAAFGSETYSKEELVAEIGSASIMNLLGIETPQTFKNSAAYIKNWLSVLKNDNKFIVSASSKAEKAVNYIFSE
jgi:antirestriction protein ArdC